MLELEEYVDNKKKKEEIIRIVNEAIDKLPPKIREALEVQYLSGNLITPRDTAKVMGIKAETVHCYNDFGKKHLKKLINYEDVKHLLE